jgi:Protein of unknown function (DUF2924)
MDETIGREIDRLARMKTKELKAYYRQLFGEEARSRNRMYLYRRLAWKLQANVHGGLSDRAQERAHRLADDVALRLLPPRSVSQAQAAPVGALEPPPEAGRDRRLPPTGSSLQRSYQGRSIEVRVLQSGFEYNGRQYASLSAVAHHATGTQWNGFTFFRLQGDFAA